MAQPLRFRVSSERWTLDRVRSELFASLESNIGAEMGTPWYALDGEYDVVRFDMDNGDTALFAWSDEAAYWLGNTETPQALWGTEKYGFDEVPCPIAEWAERELLAELYDAEAWIEPYPHLARFFLPVLCSKDGRRSSRRFFREHAAGFPDASEEEALAFYDGFLGSGILDPYRHEMAGKLGTSNQLDRTRMAAAMSEFTVAKLLSEQGYDIEPEIEVSTGHSIDFMATTNGDGHLVEVTRPGRPRDRRAGTATAAVKDTVDTKLQGQLRAHGGGVTLLVDCSSFTDAEWARVHDKAPDVGHRPAIVFRARPDGTVSNYTRGSAPVSIASE